MSRSPITVAGVQKLRKELELLKRETRPKIIEAIAEARAHGDLKENAEFHAAKEQQSFTEGRIAELEETLAQAEVIDVSALNAAGRVMFGATVDLLNLDTDENVTYQIVGELEADISQGMISITSPTARALIGKEEGDIITVVAPVGELEYEIVSVRYE